MLNTDEVARLNAAQLRHYNSGSETDQMKWASNWRISGSLLSSKIPKAPTSIMRLIGSWGTVIFGLLTVFTVSVAGADPVGGEGFLMMVLFSSLFGLCIFLWMAGAIEMRLIDINETLKHRR